MELNKENLIKNLTTKNFLVVFCLFIILLIGSFFVYSFYYANKTYIGVYVNHKNVSGYSYSDLYNSLQAQNQIFDENGIEYKYEDTTFNLSAQLSDSSLDIGSPEFVVFDNENTAKAAFSVGRKNILVRLGALLFTNRVDWQYRLEEEYLKKALKDNFSQFETSFKYPSLSYDGEDMIINDPVLGREFDYDKIIEETKKKISNFDFSPINLYLEEVESPVNLSMANKELENVNKFLNQGTINFVYDDQNFGISSSTYKNWIVFSGVKKDVYITLDFDKFKAYFEKNISIKIDEEVQSAKFRINAGKVSEFQGGKDGKKVNIEKTYETLDNLLKEQKDDFNVGDVEIVVDVTIAETATKNINDFGIEEIIGTGESDFKGSPKNRIHNIKTGANMLNGLLIAPGEEFETIQNLLPIDASSGYLQELVIKGNRTVPEYGGGLCQVGTTMFRAAFNSGLDITERRNHSYRVVYYEPAGTDATIYDPSPDLKFKNDTEGYILIQSRIVGTKLYFDFWGKKDGRKVTVTKPTIYNIKKPAATKIIETTNLKPGVKQCTESAHSGADAYFDYKVEYVDGRETKNQRFSSHYVPWQAVCLLGVSAASSTSSGSGLVGSTTESSIVVPVVPTSTNP